MRRSRRIARSSWGWLCRGTLHLVRAEDYAWLLALTAPPRFTPSARRLGQLGVTPDAADRASRSSRARSPTRARSAGRRSPSASRAPDPDGGPGDAASARTRGAAGRDGARAHGRREQRFALARDWLGRGGPVDRDAALAELARRYLAGHGPAPRAIWRLGRASPCATRAPGSRRSARGPRQRAARRRAARGAGAHRSAAARRLRSYVLGWQDRSFAVDPVHARIVHPGGGILRAVATVQGEVRGTWRLREGRVTVEPFPGERDRWRAEAADVEQYLAGTA
jgi:hypothetical protein